MKKILFACDLDNTLIHSYKKRMPSDICVEMCNDREQSFMTPYATELFCSVLENENICFLPVTTRSIQQYTRISLPFGKKIKHAIVCNGGNLLENNNINPEWKNSTDKKIIPYTKELDRIFEKFRTYKNIRTTRIVDERFVFWAFENADIAMEFFNELKINTSLTTELQGRKVYAFPDFLTKGNAVKEYMKIYGFDHLVVAGDSSIDLSMLSIAETAIIPADLAEFLNNKNILINSDGNYAEFLLKSVLTLAQ